MPDAYLDPGWGIRDAHPASARAVWGARAIYREASSVPKLNPRTGRPCKGGQRTMVGSTVELVWDRQGMSGESVARSALLKALVALEPAKVVARACTEAFIRSDDRRTYHYSERIDPNDPASPILQVKYSPRGSCGYMYLAAWLEG